MFDLAQVLLGATLVAIGVLATALADRIRGIRLTREVSAPHERARRTIAATVPADAEPLRVIDRVQPSRTSSASKPERAKPPRVESRVQVGAEGAEDVIAALAAAGYKKPTATEAAWACSVAERATIEDWTRAALRRCAQGGLS